MTRRSSKYFLRLLARLIILRKRNRRARLLYHLCNLVAASNCDGGPRGAGPGAADGAAADAASAVVAAACPKVGTGAPGCVTTAGAAMTAGVVGKPAGILEEPAAATAVDGQPVARPAVAAIG